MKIFLGYGFRDPDRELAEWCERLFASQFAHMKTGERLGGQVLSDAVRALIDDCDALVALLTRRDAKLDGTFTTHQWVLDELGYARAQRKQAIAVVENGVDVAGMYQPHEMIPLDRANPLQAFLALAETIGLWKSNLGRPVKVQIMPPELARRLGFAADQIRCSHKLWARGKDGPWKPVKPIAEVGGTFVWIEGVKEDDLIQLRIEGIGNQPMQSPATSQWMQVQIMGEDQ